MITFFLTSPIGKFVGIIGLLAFLVVSAWGALKIHDAGVRREALLDFNKKQMELVIKEQQDQKQRWENFEQTILPKLFEELSKEISNTQKKVDDVESYLNSSEANKNDRPSSEVLKEILRRLGAPE
jgi:uncharacterized protein YlxW (UPF0749 family)